MRRHAKASSAGSMQRQADGLGRIFRGGIAGRGTSSDVDGSGAPSYRGHFNVTAIALAAFALLALAPLSQAKVLVNGFGTPAVGPQAYGGQFSGFGNLSTNPRGVAVNTSGNGVPAGTAYVINGTEGNRLERFSPGGAFQRLWGQDVIATTVNETQFLTVNAGGGTYTLSFNGSTTDSIAYNAGLTAIDDALDALPSIGGDANVDVSGNSNDVGLFYITFKGSLAASDQPQVTADTGQLAGTADVVTLADGTASTASTGTGFEICTVATQCKSASNSGTTANGGQLSNPQGIAVNQSNGHVYVTESGNRRVSEFDADGNFVRAWGWDVISSGKPNDNGTGFEICDTTNGNAAADCKQGASGANGGEFGGEIGYPVTDSSNNVWIADPANRRIEEFGPTGAFIAAYGYNVDKLGGGGALETCSSTVLNACGAGTAGSLAGQFASGSPSRLALDSSGNVYAIDGGNKRVQKFDAAFTTASTFGASTFSSYTTQAAIDLTSTQGGTRLAFALTNNVTGGGERQIVELDPTDAGVKDTSLVGAGILTEIKGLGADSAGNLYATVEYGFIGGKRSGGPRQVLVFNSTPNPAPEPVLSPVTTKTDTGATFTGTVNPKGGLVSCKFQYSTDLVTWTDVPEPGCDSLSPAGGVQAVGQGVTGLVPNTHYFVRLQVSRPLVAGSTVTTPVKTFDTDSVPPVITDVGAVQVADTSARLVGTIDPRNSDTGYVFEYGATPALGSSTAPVAIGGGTTPITVSQLVGGLAKDTTYYFKLLATNAFGSTSSEQKTLHTRAVPFPPVSPGNCSNEAVRQEQSSTYLPDCRAYEIVTPPDKNQGGIKFHEAAFSADGNGMAFCTSSLFGEPTAQMSFTCAPYLSKRGPGGWTTSSPFPRYCTANFNSENYPQVLSAHLPEESYDRIAVSVPESEACRFAPLDPAAPLPEANFYRENLTTNPSSYELLAPNPLDTPSKELGLTKASWFAAGDEDFSHVIYGSYANQTADSPAQGHFFKLYDWEEEGEGGCAAPDGCLHLISVDPSGNPFTTTSKIPRHEFVPAHDAVSADGSRIYFDNDPESPEDDAVGRCSSGPACRLYMREDDTTTFQVSASECSVECGAVHSADIFLWADHAGDRALFYTCAKLTDESAPSNACEFGEFGRKIYRWDRNAAPGHRLVDLTVDNEPAGGKEPEAAGVIGASDDAGAPPDSNAAPGNTVYFVAVGQIVAGAPLAPSPDQGHNPLKLYRWRWNGGNPSVDYLGPYLATQVNGVLDVNGTTAFGEPEVDSDPNFGPTRTQVTPDGRYLAIQTKLRLDPAADRDSDVDLYRWDEADGWLCVSCQLPGAPSAGHVDTSVSSLRSDPIIDIIWAPGADHTISNDGRRLFFETPDALVPQDVNGEAGCPPETHDFGGVIGIADYPCEDVYEWHDGTLSLITSGTGSTPAHLIGATADGNDVFFATSQRMIGRDADNAADFYDARVGGGFSEPPAQPPSCEGAEQCHSAGTGAPSTTGAGTAVFEGPGDPAPKHHTTRKHHRKRHHKRAHGRHQRAKHNRRAGR